MHAQKNTSFVKVSREAYFAKLVFFLSKALSFISVRNAASKDNLSPFPGRGGSKGERLLHFLFKTHLLLYRLQHQGVVVVCGYPN